MKKRSTAAVALSLALTLTLCGCQTNDPGVSSGAVSDPPASSAYASREKQDAGDKETMDFTWQPKVYSDYQKNGEGEGWGPQMEQLYYDSVDAIMEGKESVPCPGEAYYENLTSLIRSNFPVVSALDVDLEYRDGAVQFTYAVPAEQRAQIIRAFADKVEATVNASVRKGDTPTMAALSLYCDFVRQLDIRHEAEESEESAEMTTYRALVTGEGIDRSFGSAYAYLCMQVGINAAVVRGINQDEGFEHIWTMLELNGHDYMADPTFEADMSQVGLIHFGMDQEQRMYTGQFPRKHMDAGFQLDADLNDDSFSPLWGVQNLHEVLRTPEGMVVRGASDLHGEDVIPIENGKTLTVEHMTPWQVLLEGLGPDYAKLIGTLWDVSGYEIALMDNGEAWIKGEDFDGPALYWVNDRNMVMMETTIQDQGEWQLIAEPDGTLTIKGERDTVKAEQNVGADLTEFLNKFAEYMDSAE